MRNALLHPFPIMLLLASLAIAGSAWSVLDRWSDQAPWIVLLGLLAYAASIAVIYRRPAAAPSPSPYVDPNPVPTDEDYRNYVAEALKQLHKPARLAKSQLIPLLPRTLAAAPCLRAGGRTPGEFTVLEKAQALRETVIAAIEQLRPAGETVGPESPSAHQYHILQQAYVQRKRTAYIMSRLSISESTYFRDRRDAIVAVTHQIQNQEELDGSGPAAAADSN